MRFNLQLLSVMSLEAVIEDRLCAPFSLRHEKDYFAYIYKLDIQYSLIFSLYNSLYAFI